MSDIFREVDEEIRKEDYAALWKRYGPLVIGAAVLLVLAVAGFQGWKAYQRDQALEASARYAEAVDRIGNDRDAALTALEEIADPTAEGYGLLAAFRRAELLAGKGDTDAAVAIWDRIAASAEPPQAFRAMATILSVLHRMDGGDPDMLSQRLERIAQSNQPFRATALELQGLLAHRQGETARAVELFTRIADAPDVPAAQRQRATQMLAVLEG